jgi:hypothetical protein
VLSVAFLRVLGVKFRKKATKNVCAAHTFGREGDPRPFAGNKDWPEGQEGWPHMSLNIRPVALKEAFAVV